MGWNSPDVYYQPEKFGLTIVGSIELYDEAYQFDTIVVWWHEDGTIYVGHDSGCSCPSPFEDYTTLDSLTVMGDWSALEAWLAERDPTKGSYVSSSANQDYAVEAAEIVVKVREITR